MKKDLRREEICDFKLASQRNNSHQYYLTRIEMGGEKFMWQEVSLCSTLDKVVERMLQFMGIAVERETSLFSLSFSEWTLALRNHHTVLRF